MKRRIIFIIMGSILFLLGSQQVALAACQAQCNIKITQGVNIDLNKLMCCVEKRYGYDQDTLRRSDRKTDAPTVQLSFNNTSPTEGEKVTATAMPLHFRNTNEKLYYTWYIIHTDENGNATNSLEEGKKEAMGRVARGSFDPKLFGVDYDASIADDNDGYTAPIGGVDGVGAQGGGNVGSYEQPDEWGVVQTGDISRCYKRNFGSQFDAGGDSDSGRDMIIECEHQFPSCDGTVGDGTLSVDEEQCWELNPYSPDTDGDGVPDEKDLAGVNQQEFTWNYQKGDKVGVIIEGTSMIPIKEETLNAYYKIMWAQPGICSDEADSDGGQRCAGEDDGFNYPQALPVAEQVTENIDATVHTIPEAAQFDASNESLSDPITATASINNEGVDQRYVYYDWEVYRCKDGNTEDCVTTDVFDKTNFDSNIDRNMWVSKNCKVGQQQDSDECGIVVNGPMDGIGVSSITFHPKKDLMRYSKEFFKVVLKTSRQKVDANFKRYSVSDAVVAVTQNDIDLKLYAMQLTTDGKYELKEICDDKQGMYFEMCPVFPNQIIAAKATARYTNVSSYNWMINGEPLNEPMRCPFEGCELDNTVYFPVTGGSFELSSLSVTAQRSNGENLLAQRLLTVNEPLAKIQTNDLPTAWPFEMETGGLANEVLETYPGNTVSLRADLIPDYLLASELQLTWFINGQEINEQFIQDNPDMKIQRDGNNLNFTALGVVGTADTIAVHVARIPTEAEQVALYYGWGIMNPQVLENEQTIDLKYTYIPESVVPENETASVGLFFASTIKNAPQVLVFVVQLTVYLLLVFGIAFGMKFVLGQNKNT